MFGLFTQAAMNAAIARAEEAEARAQKAEHEALRHKQVADWYHSDSVRVFTKNTHLVVENSRIKSALAKFTGPRERNEKGHFVSAKVSA